MNIFGALEEFLSETVYPYRYPVGVALLILVAAVLYLAWRLRWYEVLWGHKYLTAAIGAPALLLMSLGGYYTLSPLWERSTLCEDNPLTANVDESTFEGADCEPPEAVRDGDGDTATATADSPATPTATGDDASVATPDATTGEFEPRVVREGAWVGADDFHFARGVARLIEAEPGKFIVRVEDFSVRNGPDLFVYLSPDPDGYADGALNLGELKATDGAFNYEVPEGTDLDQFASVIIWCRQFSVLFGTAALD